MKIRDYIPFNIWDDYWDDGYVPEGKNQETHGYIEDGDIPDAEQLEMAKVVYNHLKTLDLTGVKVELSDNGVYFTHLTHKRREALVPELEAANLSFAGKPFKFYSES